MFRASLWLSLCLSALVAATPSRTVRRRAANAASPFVSVDNGNFNVNGSALRFIGTNAPYLATLNTVEDIDNTFDSMVAKGVKVVRTWAFNDVSEIPVNGTWFQLIANGTATINEGPNGLQKLDEVVKSAERHGILLHLSLTNNWNPLPLLDNITNAGLVTRDITNGTNNTLPRNTLSNDYGGMDAYVRAFGKMHDDFYTDAKIIEIFKNYTTAIVSRYTTSPAIFGWELANDPRCNSTISASSNCTTHTITRWHDDLAKHVKTVDTNHLVSSGNRGFFCADCEKLFPRTTIPRPATSPVPGSTRRRSIPAPLTKARILKERTQERKRSRDLKMRDSPAAPRTTGIRIRGQWASTPTIRQVLNSVGTAYDGSVGVDSEDILNIPQIGFGTFSLFPDQEDYALDDPNLPAFNNTVNEGLAWITRHAEASLAFGKPVSLTGFGLVTQPNAASFVPFNSTVAPYAGDTETTFGVTPEQQADAYTQWIDAAIAAGLQGIMQYQWGQTNLTTSAGTSITSTDQTGLETTTGQSPSDGYSSFGIGEDTTQQIIADAAAQISNLV